MPKSFVIKAGPTAKKHIIEKGLSPKDIAVIPAAAGGPKWISLYAMDRYLMTNWFKEKETPLNLMGASAGAWRMLCYALDNPLNALDRFLKAYIEQTYDHYPTPQEVSDEVINIVKKILGDDAESLHTESLYKLHVISSCTKNLIQKKTNYKKDLLKLVLKNTISRKSLANELSRVIFTNTKDDNFIKPDAFETSYIRFNENNTLKGLQSTGTIPTLMEPVDGINNVNGLLWDGALVDYHIGLEYNSDGLIFYPHFSDRLITGWFDKFLPWRKVKSSITDRMIMISPSRDFIKSLPDSKIPDREDFKTYFQNDAKRIRNWYNAAQKGQEIVDEFDYYWREGKLGEIAQSF